MKRIERDFITLFNCLWYRDFPVSQSHSIAGRADWTIHLGLVVRQCATLLGARALFEQGGRTDAVVRFSEGATLSYVEWEWHQAHTDINEIKKLFDRASQSVFQTFIGYSTLNDLQNALDQIQSQWAESPSPLIAFLITFETHGRTRRFLELRTYFFSKGRCKKVRSQPALPWEVDRAKFTAVSEDV